MKFTTPEGLQLRARLHDLDPSCPDSPDFLELLSQIRRDARMAVKQEDARAKYVWADEPAYKKLRADTYDRLGRHAQRLSELWLGARLVLEEGSEDFMVRALPPNNKGDWEGGVGVA
jgi:hypothetical protein